jgi:hypothetical protein
MKILSICKTAGTPDGNKIESITIKINKNISDWNDKSFYEEDGRNLEEALAHCLPLGTYLQLLKYMITRENLISIRKRHKEQNK